MTESCDMLSLSCLWLLLLLPLLETGLGDLPRSQPLQVPHCDVDEEQRRQHDDGKVAQAAFTFHRFSRGIILVRAVDVGRQDRAAMPIDLIEALTGLRSQFRSRRRPKNPIEKGGPCGEFGGEFGAVPILGGGQGNPLKEVSR